MHRYIFSWRSAAAFAVCQEHGQNRAQLSEAQAHAAASRRIPVSAEASCLSLGHFLELSLAPCHLSLHGTQLHGSCARFFGTGTTVACFHEVPALLEVGPCMNLSLSMTGSMAAV